MDAVGLAALEAETREDLRIFLEAVGLAGQRRSEAGDAAAEGCAHHLCRAYNVVEQMGLRITKAFENRIDDSSGWHSTLLTRVVVAIPGVRPALFDRDLLPALRELKGFRHVFVHAYDLVIDPRKLDLLLDHVAFLAERTPALLDRFFREARLMLAETEAPSGMVMVQPPAAGG